MQNASIRFLRALLQRAGLFPHARHLKVLMQHAQVRFLPGADAHPHRLVFIAGLPKSGTTWLENLVGAIPAYRRLACYDPRNLLYEHVLDPALLEHVPSRGNFFIKTHVEARPEAVEALRRHGVPTVVMVRDLRDQCVSRFYHVLSNPSHRHHGFYMTGDKSAAFSHCVDICVTEYADWIRGWLQVIGSDSRFMLVRYEDMRASVKTEFLRVLKHFDITLTGEEIDTIIETVAARAKKGMSLDARLRQGNNTLRAGRVGDWRNHFTVSDVVRFKTAANDILLSLGYEKDDLWLAGATS